MFGGQWSLIELDICFVSISGTYIEAGNRAEVSCVYDCQWNDHMGPEDKVEICTVEHMAQRIG